jgi:hypothetical protein
MEEITAEKPLILKYKARKWNAKIVNLKKVTANPALDMWKG